MRYSDSDGLLTASEFAARAGITVRALHLYDRLGLLKPKERSRTGYRLYGDAELERVEQIVALRFVGLPRARIKALLDHALPLDDALSAQTQLLQQQREKIDAALAAIASARKALSRNAQPWDALRPVLEVMTMQDDTTWMERYYSPEALKTLQTRREALGPEGMQRAQNDWAALIADIEAAAARNADPAGDDARELVQRWNELIAAFTGGDANVSKGLGAFWSDKANHPASFQQPWSDAAAAFMAKARGSLRCDP